MITEKAAGTDRANKMARLEADNAQLRRLAIELEAVVRDLQVAATMREKRARVDPAYRLIVVRTAERARGT
jgi:hypothetical protein